MHSEQFWELPTNDQMQLLDSLLTKPRSIYGISALLGVSDRTSVRLISDCRRLGAEISTTRSVEKRATKNIVTYLYQIDNPEWTRHVIGLAAAFMNHLSLTRKR